MQQPPLLSICTDKSLLYQLPDGRFEMLATFNQYASNKLGEVPDELIATREKFIEYYADYCAKKQLELNTPIQRECIDDMHRDRKYPYFLELDG